MAPVIEPSRLSLCISFTSDCQRHAASWRLFNHCLILRAANWCSHPRLWAAGDICMRADGFCSSSNHFVCNGGREARRVSFTNLFGELRSISQSNCSYTVQICERSLVTWEVMGETFCLSHYKKNKKKTIRFFSLLAELNGLRLESVRPAKESRGFTEILFLTRKSHQWVTFTMGKCFPLLLLHHDKLEAHSHFYLYYLFLFLCGFWGQPGRTCSILFLEISTVRLHCWSADSHRADVTLCFQNLQVPGVFTLDLSRQRERPAAPITNPSLGRPVTG